MTRPAPLTLNDVKRRTTFDDLTAEELALLESGPESWGDEVARATRGALYLDRVMPDWYERVEVKDLDLGSPCACVLGQIFSSVCHEGLSVSEAERKARGFEYEDFEHSAYNLGVRLLFEYSDAVYGEAIRQAYEVTDDSGRPLGKPDSYAPFTDEFLGFDFSFTDSDGPHATSWSLLTRTWRAEIRKRLLAAAETPSEFAAVAAATAGYVAEED